VVCREFSQIKGSSLGTHLNQRLTAPESRRVRGSVVLLPVASAGWKGMAGAAAWRRPRPIARWPPRRFMGCVPRAAGRSPAQGWPRRPAAWGVVTHDLPAAGAVADPQGGTATLAPSKTTGFSGRRRLLRRTPSRQACHGPGMCNWTARIGQSERSDHIAEQNISAQRIGGMEDFRVASRVWWSVIGGIASRGQVAYGGFPFNRWDRKWPSLPAPARPGGAR
jgi:hypothetical protein